MSKSGAMIVAHFEWLAHDRVARVAFAWTVHHRFEVYADVDDRLWRRLLDGRRGIRAELNKHATEMAPDLWVYSSGRELFQTLDASGRVFIRRGRALSIPIHRHVAPGTTNPDAVAAIHADNDCSGDPLEHAWLLTEARNESGIMDYRIFHVRLEAGAVVPPTPLLATY